MTSYRTSVHLNNFGFSDLLQDIGQQKITYLTWREVEGYLTYRQQDELREKLTKGIEFYKKNGKKISRVTVKILNDLVNNLDDMPF